jgi:hypothetical protein
VSAGQPIPALPVSPMREAFATAALDPRYAKKPGPTPVRLENDEWGKE